SAGLCRLLQGASNFDSCEFLLHWPKVAEQLLLKIDKQETHCHYFTSMIEERQTISFLDSTVARLRRLRLADLYRCRYCGAEIWIKEPCRTPCITAKSAASN